MFYHGYRRFHPHLCPCPSAVLHVALTHHTCAAPLPSSFASFAHGHQREINSHVHVLDNAQMTPSNVPNTAMLTGTARTSVGTRPRQKTRPPDSAYILCAMRHDEPRPVSVPVPVPVIVPACKRVLRTSKGNVAIQPIIPAAAPATSGGAQRWRCESASVSSTAVSGWWYGCAGVWCTGVGAKRRRVPSYCGVFFP